jgi:hypothetical protein
MKKRSCWAGVAVGGLLLTLPFLAQAKDSGSGTKMKLKNAKVIQVLSEQGMVVVQKSGGVYNIALGLADPDKTELLSKYGIMVDPFKLESGDHLTCRGRRFPSYFIPSKCKIEEGSQKDLYKKDKGVMVADVYAAEDGYIYAAHSLNKTNLTTIKQGKSKITYKGENRSLSKLTPYWRLKVKGEWDKDQNMLRKVDYIKITAKHKNETPYGY